MNEHEIAFVKRFIIPGKRQRYLGFLSKPQTRHKFLRLLSHSLAIDGTYAVSVPYSKLALITPENLRRLGAEENVYVIASRSESDQKWFQLEQGLRAEYDDYIVCCKIGELAVYFAEDRTYLLHRPR